MIDKTLLKASSMKTIEHYGIATLMAMISCKSLESYQRQALKLGFLDDAESEQCNNIIWRLLGLYQDLETQIENVLERTQMTKDSMLAEIQGGKLRKPKAETTPKSQRSPRRKKSPVDAPE